MNRFLKLRIFIAFFCFLGSFSAVFAQDLSIVTQAERSANALRQILSDATATISVPNNSSDALTDLRAAIAAHTTATATIATPRTISSNAFRFRQPC